MDMLTTDFITHFLGEQNVEIFKNKSTSENYVSQ